MRSLLSRMRCSVNSPVNSAGARPENPARRRSNVAMIESLEPRELCSVDGPPGCGNGPRPVLSIHPPVIIIILNPHPGPGPVY